MRGRAAGLVLTALLGGCGSPNMSLQQLLKLPTLPDTGAQTGSVAMQPGPHETSVVVAGTPTGVFSQVARGALRCWFAADGPLKSSHVYRAEAQPPAKGGDAEIVIRERDNSVRDLRGPRAYRIAFTAEAASVRVAMTALRFELKLAQTMAKDVEGWAKGGEGCLLRALLPPVPGVASKSGKSPKPRSAAKGQSASGKKR